MQKMLGDNQKQLDWSCPFCGEIEHALNEEFPPPCSCNKRLNYDLDKAICEIEKFLNEHKFSDAYVIPVDSVVDKDNNS